ncbi:MAG: hypothetical protein GY814_09985 [Gammaproteobacteria bacterium]|nr:hypothetical protein [Gammaproteobacteria bacterium]
MKISFYTLSLLALFWGSNMAAGQAVDLQDFEQVKKMMLPVLTKSIEPLKQTRACVVKSTNSEQLNACVEIMAEFQRGLIPGGGNAAPKMPRLEWSEVLTEQIRSDLDRSMLETSANIKCLQSSASQKAMDECARKAGVGR